MVLGALATGACHPSACARWKQRGKQPGRTQRGKRWVVCSMCNSVAMVHKARDPRYLRIAKHVGGPLFREKWLKRCLNDRHFPSSGMVYGGR